MIHTYLLNPEDSVKADHIYGPYRPLLQGGTKCCRNTDKKVPIILLPTDISLHHKNIELYFDFLNMNGITFLHTKSSYTAFLTAEKYTSKRTYNIIKKIHTLMNTYKARGFNINVYHRDNELNINSLREHIMPKVLNIFKKG